MKLYRKKYLFVFCVLYCPFIFAQKNLVINPSFESETIPAVKGYSNLPAGEVITFGWFNPTGGTPDYFNSAFSKAGKHVLALAHSGEGRVGLVLSPGKKKKSTYREYVETRFSEPLEEDKTYCISFFIAHERTSKWYAADIGIFLSRNPVSVHYDNVLPVKANASIPGEAVKSSQEFWTEICFEYDSFGGEEYLVIGSFSGKKGKSLAATGKKPEKKSLMGKRANLGYYFIDDVLVSELCNCRENTKPADEYFLVVDVSSSMKKNGSIDSVKNLLPLFASFLPERSEVTLIAFSDSVKTIFSQQKNPGLTDSIQHFTQDLSASGNTAGNNVVSELFAAIEKNEIRNADIIFFTDGEFSIEAELKQRIIQKAQKDNIRIHLAGFGNTQGEGLGDLSQKTNGLVIKPGFGKTLEKEMKKIIKIKEPEKVLYSKE